MKIYLKKTLFIFTFYIMISSCGAERANNNSIQSHNQVMISNHEYATELAYNELVKLFGSPYEFKLQEVFSAQIEKQEIYDTNIPRNIYFFYTLQSANDLYCSKFYVENRSAVKVFHKLKKEETDEFEATLNKSHKLTMDVIDGMMMNIDTMHSK